MDPKIRTLIVSGGGYAYEIAGYVLAFFVDAAQSKAFGATLANLAHISVQRCGSQLTFPISARLPQTKRARPVVLAQASRDQSSAHPSPHQRFSAQQQPGPKRPHVDMGQVLVGQVTAKRHAARGSLKYSSTMATNAAN